MIPNNYSHYIQSCNSLRALGDTVKRKTMERFVKIQRNKEIQAGGLETIFLKRNWDHFHYSFHSFLHICFQIVNELLESYYYQGGTTFVFFFRLSTLGGGGGGDDGKEKQHIIEEEFLG